MYCKIKTTFLPALCLTYFLLCLQFVHAQVWSSHNSGVASILHGITSNGTTYISVGVNGVILSSPDGRTWSPQVSGTANTLTNVYWDGASFIAVGFAGTILSSLNGITWTTETSGTANQLNDIIWNGALFVVSGDVGTILTSPDGINWTTQTSNTADILSAVSWKNALFITVGGNGTILSSPDGVTWTAQNAGVTTWLQDVTWNGSFFLAVGFGTTPGDAGAILSSADGLTWNVQTHGINEWFYSIAWDGTYFSIVGVAGAILSSTDGMNWLIESSGVANDLLAVHSNGFSFLAVGEPSKVLRTGVNISNPNIILDVNGTTTGQINTTGGTPTLNYATANAAVTTVSTTGLVSLADIGSTTITVTDFYSSTDTANIQVTNSLLSALNNGDYTPIVSAPSNLTGVIASSVNGVLSSDAQLTAFLAGATAIDTEDGSLTGSITHNAPATLPAAQTTTVIFSVTDSYGHTNTANATVAVNAFDNVAPVITANGADPYSFEVGLTYVDPLATMTDNVDATDVALVGISTVISGTVGNYTVTYDYTDFAGNVAATLVRDVYVQDTTLPVIVLNGTDPYTVEAGQVYVDAYATVTDNVDITDVTFVGVSTVNIASPESYTVTYDYTDVAGNVATTVVRDVYVVDTTAPLFTGAPFADITRQASGTNTAVTFTTPIAFDLFPQIVSHDAPAGFPVGTTILTWTATDFYSNVSTATQNIVIIDTIAPTLSNLPTVINVPSTVALSGASITDTAIVAFLATPTATDTVDGVVTVTNNAPTVLPLGINTITFTATDNAGNSRSFSSTITVNDASAPAASGTGLSIAQSIALGLDPNATTTDTDGDGISDATEIGDPNNPFDLDNDGVLDVFEAGNRNTDASIASGMPVGNGTVTISSGGQTISNVSHTTIPTSLPPSINFPYGVIDYTTTVALGASQVVRLTFSIALPANVRLYKIDAADNAILLPSRIWTKTDAFSIELTLTDGDPETDLDGVANGIIVDPLAVGGFNSPVVPAASGGGCSLSQSKASSQDPLLPAMVIFSLFWLAIRRIRHF